MATVEDLIKQYKNDPAMQAEVKEILKDGKVSLAEFRTFAKNHNVEISLADLPKYVEKAKELGFLK